MKRLVVAVLLGIASIASARTAFAQCDQDTLRAWITDDAHNNRDTLRAWLENDLGSLHDTLLAQVKDDTHNSRDTLRAWLENDLSNLHDTLRAQIDAAIAASESDILAQMSGTLNSYAIEQALLRKDFIASIYLPQAQGGQLETVQTLVQQTIAKTGATSEGNNNAASALSQESFLWSGGRYKALFLQYAIAYCRAVTPQSRLALCN